MYGPKKKKMGIGGKAERQPMMYGKMPKRKQANMGRLMYNEGGMYSHGEMPKAKAN
jgi:hypothetical protein